MWYFSWKLSKTFCLFFHSPGKIMMLNLVHSDEDFLNVAAVIGKEEVLI